MQRLEHPLREKEGLWKSRGAGGRRCVGVEGSHFFIIFLLFFFFRGVGEQWLAERKRRVGGGV